MARIAYCWELGAGLGHLTAFLPMARLLQERGHEVFCISKELIGTGELLEKQGFKVFQAPYWTPNIKNLPSPVNYAEILFGFGYVQEERVFEKIKAWENLLRAVGPDIVILDHAPSASLAARNLPVKRFFFGTGFCAPPQLSPMPSIRPDKEVPAERMQESENVVLRAVNGALEAIGSPGLDRLMNLFDCDENFLATFPELDHYQERQGVRYWGPQLGMDEGEDPAWPGKGSGPKIFAYLKAEAGSSEKVLQVLKKLHASVLVYATGFDDNRLKSLKSKRLRFAAKMLNLKKVCRDCDLVICHGGHGTVARALLEGTPVVMLPTQVEQFLMAGNVVKLGAGTMANQFERQPDYAGAIRKALVSDKIHKKAEEFANRHADFNQEKQAAAIVSRMEELVRAS